MKKISVGVSSCLLGNNVRYNAGNCHKQYLTKSYSEYFDYVAVCPEVSAGLGVPRDTMFLIEDIQKNTVTVKTSKEHKNVTKDLVKSSQKIISKLGDVYGFILKAKSPSCGVETARVFDENHGYTGRKADGLFVRVLREYNPLIPIEDDGRLNDKSIREHFLTRVFCYFSLKTEFMSAKNVKEMSDFHAKQKVLLRLYNNQKKKQLGRMLSNVGYDTNVVELKKRYIEVFMHAISKPVTRTHHYMALQNVLREINKKVSKSQRKYLQEILDKYKRGQVSREVPISIVKMHLVDLGLPYLSSQSYLTPYPEDLD